jgi:pimeloyl-ACP methyl ester carboxylesterase
MRAREPDVLGSVVVDDLEFGFEVHGDRDPTILLMPTWTIIHSRFWKFQIPYLARRNRVITYDGPGNGRSPRTIDPTAYAVEAFVDRAVAVLDAVGTQKAVVVGYSDGGKMAAAFAGAHPDRTLGLVMISPSLRVPEVPPSPERAAIAENFHEPYPPDPTGWEKYNAAYWADHYEDFLHFFFPEVFSETYTTKPEDDCISWGMETNGAVLTAEALRPPDPDHDDVIAAIETPTLVVHGTEDRLVPFEAGRRLSEITGGEFAAFHGTGHAPHIKEPVRFNLILRDFVERVSP